MQFLLLQTFVWMLLAGLLGAVLGCMAHRFFAGRALEDAVGVPASVAMAKPAVMTPPVAARVVPKAPVVEASKAPAPVAPAAPATVPDRTSGGYTYPVTTVGIPRANPELVQPQIQTIHLPAAAAAGAGSVAAAVTIRQPASPAAAPVAANIYPITTVGIPQGYVETSTAAKSTGDVTRFERALTGEQAQPRPEPLRPELGRSPPVVVPAAPVATAPAFVAPVATTVAPPAAPVTVAPAAPVTVAPSAPAPVKPVAPPVAATVTPAAPAPVAPVPVAPGAPARVAKVANAPIATKPAGIAAGSPPIGPIASKPAGIPPPASETLEAAPVATKPAAAADVAFAPVVAGGAALAAIAARAASAQAAAAAAANAATSAPVASAPVAPAPAAPVTVAPQAASGGDDLLRIRSVDSAMQTRLKAAGVTRFNEIARWTPNDVSRISQSLGLSGRIEQENWIEQAQILATGGETDYSRRRLRGEIPTATAAATVAPAAIVAPAAVAAVAPGKPVDAPTVATVAPAAAAKPPAASGADTSIAAATAAAAAMASAAIVRATANVEPSMPSKLVDAIRENLAKPAAPVVAATAAVVAPAAPAVDAGRVLRPDLAGLRSVRSEALRDPTPAGGTGRQGGAVEDLKRIRGIGVLIEKKLNSLGVTGYEQIAHWTNADIDRVSQILDFKGRIERENWVEQARILASGGQTEFSKRVDRGEA